MPIDWNALGLSPPTTVWGVVDSSGNIADSVPPMPVRSEMIFPATDRALRMLVHTDSDEVALAVVRNEWHPPEAWEISIEWRGERQRLVAVTAP
jgi:hypothetical protein